MSSPRSPEQASCQPFARASREESFDSRDGLMRNATSTEMKTCGQINSQPPTPNRQIPGEPAGWIAEVLGVGSWSLGADVELPGEVSLLARGSSARERRGRSERRRIVRVIWHGGTLPLLRIGQTAGAGQARRAIFAGLATPAGKFELQGAFDESGEATG
jgi:hypothetical protein